MYAIRTTLIAAIALAAVGVADEPPVPAERLLDRSILKALDEELSGTAATARAAT